MCARHISVIGSRSSPGADDDGATALPSATGSSWWWR